MSRRCAPPACAGPRDVAAQVDSRKGRRRSSVQRAQEMAAAAQEQQKEAFALDVAISLKRAEREKKKSELEAEFASVFADVERKKRDLKKMEESIADMEATRQRKDREFSRLQRNLTELLQEQKAELDSLREKGIQLEAATATSAAAAASTAAAAKEHEQRTQVCALRGRDARSECNPVRRAQAIFNSTEELMKFQFMSMSLAYFQSLKMLGNLRDINAGATSVGAVYARACALTCERRHDISCDCVVFRDRGGCCGCSRSREHPVPEADEDWLRGFPGRCCKAEEGTRAQARGRSWVVC